MGTKIHIVSGFLGAGKTTFLKKVLPCIDGKVALIENEYGQVGIDGDLLDQAIPKREIYAGCICCSIVKDFEFAVESLVLEHRPEHLFVEPSGVGSLSEIIKVCQQLSTNKHLDLALGHRVTLVDVSALDDYLEGFGAFYEDQIENATTLLLSYYDIHDPTKNVAQAAKLQKMNPNAFIWMEEWHAQSAEQLIGLLKSVEAFSIEVDKSITEKPVKKSADSIFTTLSITAPRVLKSHEVESFLAGLHREEQGQILRAKGFMALDPSGHLHFDYTPYHCQWKRVDDVTSAKVAVIGTNLNSNQISKYFSGGL